MKTNIPKLRFIEFKDAPAWEEKKLGEVAEFHNGRRIPLSDSERQKIKGDYPYYGASGIIDGINDYIFDGEYILLGEDGANIISRSTRLCFVVKGKFWVNNHAHVMNSIGNTYFLAETLEKKNYRKYNTGTAQPKLNAEVCKNIPVNTPSLKEQDIIGKFLSTLDKRIGLQEKLIEKLEEEKKGYLQKLFPKKGKNIPELRFEEFKDSMDWSLGKLGDICNIRTGKLDANAMVRDGKYEFYTSGINKYKIDTFAFEGPSITIAGNGATVGYMHYADGKFNAYQRTYVLSDFTGDRRFIYNSIQNELPKIINREARTGNIPYIVISMLTDLHLKIAIQAEQKNVADIIESLDHVIDRHGMLLIKLKQTKYYMLQKVLI